MLRARSFRAFAWTLIGTAVAATLAGCATAGAESADPDAVAERASAIGIAPELVYTTEVDGYDLAPQSVGPADTDGMSATWFNQDTAAMVTLRTDRTAVSAESCAERPLWDAPDTPVTCTEEAAGVWRRSGGGVEEYVTVRDSAAIWVIGANNAPPEELRAAAEAVRVPSASELELLFSAVPEFPEVPVERGDLPENGDGAPIQPTGPGG